MKAVRYLVLIHLAAKASRENLPCVASQLGDSIRNNLSNSEAICTTPVSLAFVGLSPASADSLFRSIAAALRPGDNLSVMELGKAITTSHPGVRRWAQKV